MWSCHLFFIQKNKKKILNTKYMTELFNSHWLNKKYKLDKFSITWLWVLVTNYQKYMAFCPSYSLPKKKKMKIKPRSTYPNTLNSEARLWSGKVLSTHSTQIESGLLDSHDQCTHFMHDMNGMLHTWKTNHISLFMNASSSLLKNSDLCYR